MKSRLFFSLILVLAVTGFGYASTIRVPLDQPTIQAAIDAASDGDTVLVADGLYLGEGNVDIDFSGKAITVKSKTGPGATVIHCENNSRGFIFQDGENESSMLSGFTIKGGKADRGGAIYCKDSSPTIESNTITESEASYGGGIYCTNASPNIINNVITDNSAYNGGGIYCTNSSPTITKNEIANNVVQGRPTPMISFGGGGIYCTDSSSPSITNNVITCNSAYRGGGIYCGSSSSPSIINNVIAYNEVSGTGGGIYCSSGMKPFVLNTIIWENKSEQVWGSINIYYSNVQGGWEGIDNIDMDPLFVNAENGDYHLQPDSPCIDAGYPNPQYNDPDGTRNDMGAYGGLNPIPPVPEDKPIISDVSPDFGPTTGGTVTITGKNFVDGATVKFGQNEAADVSVVSDTEITVRIPAAAEVNTVDVTVINPDGKQVSLADGFRYLSYECPQPGIHQAVLSLTTGVNIISLPLRPDNAYTASALAKELAATIIIRAKDSEFQVYAPADGYDDFYGIDFPIEMGKGYIVNVLKETKFSLTGRAWGTEVPAAPSAPTGTAPTDTWAFAVVGSLLDETPQGASILVANHRTGQSIIAHADASGQFTAAFVDVTKRSVVVIGDEISLQILDSHGNPIGQPKRHYITSAQLARAYILSTLKIPPTQTRLLPNYPNPFNPETWIPYQLALASPVTISIYNAKGQLIRTITLGHQAAGIYISKDKAAHWDGRNDTGEEVSNGVYFYNLRARDFKSTRRMLIVK